VLGKEAFITYHPSGGEYSTSQQIHSEPWLDMNTFQSGHGARENARLGLGEARPRPETSEIHARHGALL